jgi:hypothetical protein
VRIAATTPSLVVDRSVGGIQLRTGSRNGARSVLNGSIGSRSTLPSFGVLLTDLFTNESTRFPSILPAIVICDVIVAKVKRWSLALGSGLRRSSKVSVDKCYLEFTFLADRETVVCKQGLSYTSPYVESRISSVMPKFSLISKRGGALYSFHALNSFR